MENGLESTKEEVKRLVSDKIRVRIQVLVTTKTCDRHMMLSATLVDLQPGKGHCPTGHQRSIHGTLSFPLPNSATPIQSIVKSRGRDIVKDFQEKKRK